MPRLLLVLVVATACVAETRRLAGPDAPVATVTVTPSSGSITVGDDQQFVAVVRDSAGALITDRPVTWSTVNASVATIGSDGRAQGMGAGSTTITATSEGKSGSATLAVVSPPATLVRVILTPDTIVIVASATRQFTAMARMSDSSLAPVTAIFSGTGGSISTAGLYTAGVVAGTFRVIATAQGKADTSTVTIQLAPVATVTVTPAADTIPIDGTVQLTGTPRDAAGNALVGRVVTWQTSNPAVASVSGGLVTGVAAGVVTITASCEGQNGTAAITVAAGAPTLVRITLTPDTIVIFTGATRAFTTSGRMSDSSTVSITPTYSATGGTINTSGTYTAGSTAGPFRVIASHQGRADTSLVTIQLRPVVSVTVAPSVDTITVGGTQQLTATLRDTLGNILTGRAITWTSGNALVATVSTAGLVSGVAPGATTITASSEGRSGTAAITVSPGAPTLVRITLTPDTIVILTGATRTFSTTARMSDSTTVPITPTYTATGGTINSSGVYTAGSAAGTFRAIASHQGKADTSTVTIQLRPVASVTVAPANDTIAILGTVQLTATLRDAQGSVLTGRTITWASGNAAVATVVGGLVAGVTAGTTTITATSEGQVGSATVMVSGTQATIDTLFSAGFDVTNALTLWDDVFGSSPKQVVLNATAAQSGAGYLEITYPAGGDGGAITKFFGFGAGQTGGYDKVYARYWVKFPSNWQGGTKLLLLRGSRTDNQWSSFGVAGQCPNGTNFFATNVVTRNLSTLPLRFYSYYVGMARESDGVTCWGRHGNNEDPGGTPNPAATYYTPLDVSKGVWHQIEFEVTLNTPGQSNGVQRFWLDGVLKGEWSGLNFRTSSILKLNAVTLEASMNPGTSPQTQILAVDNLLVTTGRP